MAEDLTPADVEAYTRGLLLASDPETARALNAALARARRHCNWHVSPVITETLVLEGTGRALLPLPTLRPVEIISVTEDGIPVDATLTGIMLRRDSGYWCGTVEVELSHGYPAAEAEDFREAVLILVDQAASNVGARGDGMIEKQIDDVRVKWSDASGLSDEVRERLEPYKRLSWYVG